MIDVYPVGMTFGHIYVICTNVGGLFGIPAQLVISGTFLKIVLILPSCVNDQPISEINVLILIITAGLKITSESQIEFIETSFNY